MEQLSVIVRLRHSRLVSLCLFIALHIMYFSSYGLFDTVSLHINPSMDNPSILHRYTSMGNQKKIQGSEVLIFC